MAGALLVFTGLGLAPAMETTDARYLAISREMVDSGDYLTPRLAGLRHLEKPPFAYWAAAAGFRLFGTNEFGGRFAQGVAVLASAWLVLRIGRRIGSPEAAVVGGAAFATSALVFGTSRVLCTDVFNLFFVIVALDAGLRAAEGRLDPARAALAGAALGAAMLVKGPIALLVSASVWLPFALLPPRAGRLPWRGVVLGAALFCAIGLPWYAWLVAHEPRLLGWFTRVQIGERLIGGGAGHPHGPAYYAWVWPLALLPWTPLVALALVRLAQRGRAASDPVARYLLLWALAPVILFSCFATKLSTYILPALPGAALALARVTTAGELDGRAGRRALGATCSIVGAVALALAFGLATERGHELLAREGIASGALAHATAYAGALFLLGLAALSAPALRGGGGIARRASLQAALAAGVLGVGSAALAPGVPETLREEAALVTALPDARLVEVGRFAAGPLFYGVSPDHFYLAESGRRLENAETPRVREHLALDRRGARALLREPVPTFALVRARVAANLARTTGSREVSRRGELVLLANAEAARRLAAKSALPASPAPWRAHPAAGPRAGPNRRS